MIQRSSDWRIHTFYSANLAENRLIGPRGRVKPVPRMRPGHRARARVPLPMDADQASSHARVVPEPAAGPIARLVRCFLLQSLVVFAFVFGMVATASAPPPSGSNNTMAEEREDSESANETSAHARASRRPGAGAGPSISRIQEPCAPQILVPPRQPPPPRTWHRPRRPAPDDDDDDESLA